MRLFRFSAGHLAGSLVALALSCGATPGWAQRWVTSWAAAAEGPYPSGPTLAQPEMSFALPEHQVRDQTFRMIVRPSVWGARARLRFSNAFGDKPLVLDTVLVGLQMSSASVAPGTNRPVTFKGKKTVTIAPGAEAWSDATTLPFASNPSAPDLQGRKLAVSFHVAGEVAAPTWHSLAMQTSYITPPEAGALGELEDESVFPNSTTSWFFLDAIDMLAAPGESAVVCLGDSITDGYGSTLNGDDRWPDVLSRRLQGLGVTMAVVDEGLAGNRIIAGAADRTAPGVGPSALDRLDRDVIGLSGVSHVIWLEGINDLAGNTSFDQVRDAMIEGVKRIRAKIRGVKVIGATLTPIAGVGSPEQDMKRRALNEFIRHNDGVFDGVIDFEAAVIDRGNGALRPEYVPDGTLGKGPDFLHPNRAGYLAMGDAIDLRLLHAPETPKPRPKPKPQAEPEQAPETDEGQ